MHGGNLERTRNNDFEQAARRGEADVCVCVFAVFVTVCVCFLRLLQITHIQSRATTNECISKRAHFMQTSSRINLCIIKRRSCSHGTKKTCVLAINDELWSLPGRTSLKHILKTCASVGFVCYCPPGVVDRIGRHCASATPKPHVSGIAESVYVIFPIVNGRVYHVHLYANRKHVPWSA